MMECLKYLGDGRDNAKLEKNLHSLPATIDAYTHTDSEFLKSENSQNRDAGSTSSIAILVGDRLQLQVANVGDSRAVICRRENGSAMFKRPKISSLEHLIVICQEVNRVVDERVRIRDAANMASEGNKEDVSAEAIVEELSPQDDELFMEAIAKKFEKGLRELKEGRGGWGGWEMPRSF